MNEVKGLVYLNHLMRYIITRKDLGISLYKAKKRVKPKLNMKRVRSRLIGISQECRTCKKMKPYSSFRIVNSCKTGYSKECKDCYNASQRKKRFEQAC